MWKKYFGILSYAISMTLSAQPKVLAFAGSTRTDSVNKKLIREAAQIATKQGAQVTLIDLRDYPIPFYDGDLETAVGMPPKAQEIRQLMLQHDVFLIATPEYNGSLPAVLKNVLDWVSRNGQGAPSKEAFQGKRIALMSASPGSLGGARAVNHLKIILQESGASIVNTTLSVPDAYKAFDSEGHLKDPKMRVSLENLIQAALYGSSSQ